MPTTIRPLLDTQINEEGVLLLTAQKLTRSPRSILDLVPRELPIVDVKEITQSFGVKIWIVSSLGTHVVSLVSIIVQKS